MHVLGTERYTCIQSLRWYAAALEALRAQGSHDSVSQPSRTIPARGRHLRTPRKLRELRPFCAPAARLIETGVHYLSFELPHGRIRHRLRALRTRASNPPSLPHPHGDAFRGRRARPPDEHCRTSRAQGSTRVALRRWLPFFRATERSSISLLRLVHRLVRHGALSGGYCRCDCVGCDFPFRRRVLRASMSSRNPWPVARGCTAWMVQQACPIPPGNVGFARGFSQACTTAAMWAGTG